MIDAFLVTVANEIETIIPHVRVEIGTLSKNSVSIALRVMPSGNGGRFMDGDRERKLLFQVLVKSNKQIEAIQLSDKINKHLEFLGILTYSEPNYLESDYTYTASYEALL